MTLRRGWVLALVLTAACGPEGNRGVPADAVVTADTVDPNLQLPGTVFRAGPASPEAMNGAVYPPVVVGAEGQISIFDGYFVQAPCSLPLQRAVRVAGDTIVARFFSLPDTTLAGPCQEDEKAIGYAMLVGQFEPGPYAVRIIHEGDRARPAPLDTVYENIIVQSK